MKIGIVCYPTFGGSGVVATELGKALADNGHQVHFITYNQPARLDFFSENLFYHEVSVSNYPLFDFPPYELALASRLVISNKVYLVAMVGKGLAKLGGYNPASAKGWITDYSNFH